MTQGAWPLERYLTMEQRVADWRPGRRSERGTEPRQAYSRVVVTAALALAALIGLDSWLLYKRWSYLSEIGRLRAAMTGVEGARADALLAATADRYELQLELMRRVAQGEGKLNLAIAADEGRMYLQQEGAQLRSMRVRLGPEYLVGPGPGAIHVVPPRGKRTVLRVVDGTFAWPVPSWVYAQRGLAVPRSGTEVGALGRVAILLQGGAVIYAMPSAGPLAGTDYVLPGSLRANAADLQAIAESVVPGMPVYFY